MFQDEEVRRQFFGTYVQERVASTECARVAATTRTVAPRSYPLRLGSLRVLARGLQLERGAEIA